MWDSFQCVGIIAVLIWFLKAKFYKSIWDDIRVSENQSLLKRLIHNHINPEEPE